MSKGKMEHYYERVGKRSVHVIPWDGVFETYFQIDGYPMMYAFGTPQERPDGNYNDLQDAFIVGWDNFDLYEEDMFR